MTNRFEKNAVGDLDVGAEGDLRDGILSPRADFGRAEAEHNLRFGNSRVSQLDGNPLLGIVFLPIPGETDRP